MVQVRVPYLVQMLITGEPLRRGPVEERVPA